MRNLFRKQKPAVEIDVTEQIAAKAGRKPKVPNPFHPDKKPLSNEQSEYVLKVREARANARREMRSGNPAKRAAAAVVYRTAPRIIRAVYAQEARR